MASTLPIESTSSLPALENLPKELVDWFENVKKIEGVAKTVLRAVGRKSLDQSKTFLEDPFDLIQAAQDFNVQIPDLRPFQEEDYVELMDDIKNFIQGAFTFTVRVHATAYTRNGTLLNERTWLYLL
jgi:hypothetical protein